MDFILAFSVALQTIAAFVIFLVGYAALFISLFICFALARVCTKARRGDLGVRGARRQKRLFIPA
jgi:hypothetical protein